MLSQEITAVCKRWLLVCALMNLTLIAFGWGSCSKPEGQESAQGVMAQKELARTMLTAGDFVEAKKLLEQLSIVDQKKPDVIELVATIDSALKDMKQAEVKCKVLAQVMKRGVMVDPIGRQPTEDDYDRANAFFKELSGYPEDEYLFIEKINEILCAYNSSTRQEIKSAIQKKLQLFEREFFSQRKNTLSQWKGTVHKGSAQNVVPGNGFKVEIASSTDYKVSFKQDSMAGDSGNSSQTEVAKTAGSLPNDACVIVSGKVNPEKRKTIKSDASDELEYPIELGSLKPCE